MQPEDIDKLFHDLLEQLEPEEKKRRGGFFWMAVAAAVTLLLVAGGGWLVWQQQPGGSSTGTLASSGTTTGPGQQPRPTATPATTAPTVPATPNTATGADAGIDSTLLNLPLDPATIAARTDAAPTTGEAAKNFEKSATSQATVLRRSSSTHQQQQLLACTERAAAPRPTARPEKPDFQPAAPGSVAEQPALAAQAVTAPVNALVAAADAAPNAKPAATPQMGAIEVEVRQHADDVAAVAAPEAADEPGRTRPSVRNVVRQLRRVAQGQKLDLTEVGLPAKPAVTVQARVAGRTLTKTISL